MKNVNVDETMLLGCWKYSYEEDEGSDRIYRSCDYKVFPLSRYRNQFTLETNDEATYLVLSPNDSHFTEKGQWTYEPNSKTLSIINKDGDDHMKFKVEKLSKDKLQLKKV